MAVARACIAGAVLAACVTLGACGSNSKVADSTGATSGAAATTAPPGVTDATCAQAMQRYHDDLASSCGDLTNEQEQAHMDNTINSCTRSMWLSEVQPYVGSDINSDIVVGTPPEKVLKLFCSGSATAPACQ